MRSKIEAILTGSTQAIYCELLDAINSYTSPSAFIDTAWKIYSNKYPNKQSVNGRVFEYLIVETLAQEGIEPIYFQAKFNHVPNCEFDIVLYHHRLPVVLSAKVSLRERYKQADLEGLALRQVYRQASQHLITLSEKEAMANRSKIVSGDISGLDSIVVANKPEYDDLIEHLKKLEFQYGKPITPIKGRLFPGQNI